MDKIEEFIDCNLSNCYRLSVLSEIGEGFGEEAYPVANTGEGSGRCDEQSRYNYNGWGGGKGNLKQCNVHNVQRRLIQ